MVAKWKKRTAVNDLPIGPKDAHSTVPGIEEEAIIVAFRRHTLLPLDDCLFALQVTIPHLTRSSLHRCVQRHGISRLRDYRRLASNMNPQSVYLVLAATRRRGGCTAIRVSDANHAGRSAHRRATVDQRKLEPNAGL